MTAGAAFGAWFVFMLVCGQIQTAAEQKSPQAFVGPPTQGDMLVPRAVQSMPPPTLGDVMLEGAAYGVGHAIGETLGEAIIRGIFSGR